MSRAGFITLSRIKNKDIKDKQDNKSLGFILEILNILVLNLKVRGAGECYETSSRKVTRAPQGIAPLFFTAVLCALLTAPVSRALADLAWQSSTVVKLKVGGGEREMENGMETMSLKGNVLRVDDPAGGAVRFYNFSNRSCVMVDLRGRAFIVMSLDDLIAEARRNIQDIKNDLPQREAMLPGVQGDDRDVLAAQLEAQKIKYELWAPGHAYQVRPTEETAEVLGHKCRKFEGMSGDTVFQEIWVTEDFELEPAYQRYFARFMNQLEPNTYAHLAKVPGFPVRVVSRYGPVTVTNEAANISTSALPVDAFTLADDLRESPLVNRQP